ncbi:MAG: hypothetical protein QOC56_2921 [Alphaproteobacteria bacterium]|nr:hypothetical protein [Alphaproteobacteria bacterium]
MLKIRIAIAAALTLCVVIPIAAEAREVKCTHSLAQYTQAISHFEAEAAKARTLAVRNPLYESDLAYLDSVLGDARQCVKTLGPMTTAAAAR